MRGPATARRPGPDGGLVHEVGRLVDRLVELNQLRWAAVAAGDEVEAERLLALEVPLSDRLDDLVHPAGREPVRRVRGGDMARKTTSTEVPVEVPRPLEDALRVAEAELANLPGLIEAATAAGDEAALGKGLLRQPILEARVRHLRGQRDTGYHELLEQHLADARARHAETVAEQAGVIAELQGRLATATAKVAAAWTEVLEARWAAEEEERRKPDWWWTEQNLVPPGSTPVADRVKSRVIPDRRMAAFYAEQGDTRYGPSPVTYDKQTTTEEAVPTPPIVTEIVEGRYQGLNE